MAFLEASLMVGLSSDELLARSIRSSQPTISESLRAMRPPNKTIFGGFSALFYQLSKWPVEMSTWEAFPVELENLTQWNCRRYVQLSSELMIWNIVVGWLLHDEFLNKSKWPQQLISINDSVPVNRRRPLGSLPFGTLQEV